MVMSEFRHMTYTSDPPPPFSLNLTQARSLSLQPNVITKLINTQLLKMNVYYNYDSEKKKESYYKHVCVCVCVCVTEGHRK